MTEPEPVKKDEPLLDRGLSKMLDDREGDKKLFLLYTQSRKLDPNNGKLLNQDMQLRNVLASRNCKLVTYVVNKFYNRKDEHKQIREDLLQEGNFGLLSAIEKYDPERGRFSTYACWWIRHAINNYLQTQDPQLHVPSHIRTAQNKVLKTMKEQNLGFQDLVDSNAQTLGVTEKMLDSINSSLRSKWVSSLDTPFSGSSSKTKEFDGSMTLRDLLMDLEGTPTDSQVDYRTVIDCVKRGLASLSEREKTIILLRYDVIQKVEEPRTEQDVVI